MNLTLSAGCASGPNAFVVALFDARSRIVAKSHRAFTIGQYPKDTVLLDTAPYRISDTERAFGVRNTHEMSLAGECYGDEVLHLFRIVGDDIVLILTADVGYTELPEGAPNNFGEEHPECPLEKSKRGTFRMLSTKTAGFFDLERMMPDKRRTVYHWNGSSYDPETPNVDEHQLRADWDRCTGKKAREYYEPLDDDSGVASTAAATPPLPTAKASARPTHSPAPSRSTDARKYDAGPPRP